MWCLAPAQTQRRGPYSGSDSLKQCCNAHAYRLPDSLFAELGGGACLPLVAGLQGDSLQANMELTRLREDLKLTTGRLNTATGQAADLLQQLKSVQAENASLMSQLALSQGRDTEAAAAHAALQEALESMREDVKRCSNWDVALQGLVQQCRLKV